MIAWLNRMSAGKKRIIIFLYDSVAAAISYPLALWIRYGHLEIEKWSISDVLWKVLILAFVIKIFSFMAFKIYRGIWSFSSIPDLFLVIKTASVAMLGFIAITFLWIRLEGVPRSSFIIDWILLVMLLGGGRLTYRVWREKSRVNRGNKTILVGAGSAAEQLIREVRRNKSSEIQIVAIVDDDKEKLKRTLHGISVRGSTKDIERIAERYDVSQVIIAIPSATSKEIRRINDLCVELGLKVQTLPSLADIVDGKVQFSQLRPVKVEDLLGRDPVSLDLESLTEMLTEKVILVTGAGGSIGSELCNQILKFRPKQLILFEICELFIYQTEYKLKQSYPEVDIIPVVGDVTNPRRVKEIFNKHKPEIVFHAAAYKHVPMMESNATQAISNNVGGSYNVTHNAIEAGVKKFVLISTDKAVNPTNIMGASKRVAEIVCTEAQKTGETQFITLRFGNVLGSAGSVIPRFMDQIKAGGPVTVTHPEITRFFMSIPEATQLVLQAGARGKGGEIYVLDMGEPVKIIDLAKDLIKLSGADVEIAFTGLRPGEKLYEELLVDSENTLPTAHEKVRVAQVRSNGEGISDQIMDLIGCSVDELVRGKLKKVVPEYVIKEDC